MSIGFEIDGLDITRVQDKAVYRSKYSALEEARSLLLEEEARLESLEEAKKLLQEEGLWDSFSNSLQYV